MSPEQIAEIFIQAAETDRRLPNTAQPTKLKAMALPYVHDHTDQNGWGAERYQQERSDFFDAKSTRLTKNEVRTWELAMELIKLVPSAKNRRALSAWATAKAGGMSLSRWSRTVEHVHPVTTQRRAKAAISRIHQTLCSNGDLHNGNRSIEVLPQEPEISDKKHNIEVWRPDESRPLRCDFDTDIAGREWAEIQNEKRRERQARKKKSA